MGKRGPPRKPLETLQRRGSWLATQRKDDGFIQTEPGIPICPSHLSRREKVVWRETVGHLSAMGVLAVADRAAVARYCRMSVRWRDLADIVAKGGETYLTRRVVQPHEKMLTDEDHEEIEIHIQARPEVGILDKLTTQLLRIEQQFGMTPAARSSIQVAGNKGAEGRSDAKLRLLKKAQG